MRDTIRVTDPEGFVIKTVHNGDIEFARLMAVIAIREEGYEEGYEYALIRRRQVGGGAGKETVQRIYRDGSTGRHG